MKKLLRLSLTVGLLSSLAISQIPQRAQCEMAYGGLFAVSCRMPCCQKTLPMSHCPFLKAQAPHDFITVSAPALKAGLQPLHTLAIMITSETVAMSTLISNITGTYELLFIGPTQPTRAPPAYIHLLAA